MFTTSNLSNLFAEIKSEVVKYNAEYLIKHPSDWDCCGFASLKVYFGRGRKLKNAMMEAGLLGHSYKDWKGTHFMITIPTMFVPCVGHQSLTYKENRCRVIMAVMIKHFPELEGKIMKESYMD